MPNWESIKSLVTSIACYHSQIPLSVVIGHRRDMHNIASDRGIPPFTEKPRYVMPKNFITTSHQNAINIGSIGRGDNQCAQTLACSDLPCIPRKALTYGAAYQHPRHGMVAAQRGCRTTSSAGKRLFGRMSRSALVPPVRCIPCNAGDILVRCTVVHGTCGS